MDVGCAAEHVRDAGETRRALPVIPAVGPRLLNSAPGTAIFLLAALLLSCTMVPSERKVLLLNIDPLVNGTPLTQVMGWNDPQALAAEYISDVRTASGGELEYRIVAVETDLDFPVKEDGFAYTGEEYLRVARKQVKDHQPDGVDYAALLDKHRIADRANAGEFDELWVFGAPWFGFYESRLAGKGGYWYNSPPLEYPKLDRLLPIMGFSYERGVAEMLEDLGHRTEATMTQVYGGWNASSLGTPWDRFTMIDRDWIGEAHVGSVHFPPNGRRDYDWGSAEKVWSNADGWLTYPDVQERWRMVSCREWGCTARGYLNWWFSHLPRQSGKTDGVLNNWWAYVRDPMLAASRKSA